MDVNEKHVLHKHEAFVLVHKPCSLSVQNVVCFLCYPTSIVGNWNYLYLFIYQLFFKHNNLPYFSFME